MKVRQDRQEQAPIIRTPEHRLRVFLSSTLKELAAEREAARQAVVTLRLIPVMFEAGARSHPSHELYRAYLSQSHLFIGIYWQSYGWVPEGEKISGLEDEFLLSADLPRLIYIKDPKAEREPALKDMLIRIKSEDTISYKYFSIAEELKELVENDLALLLTEHFEMARADESASAELSDHPLSNIPTPRNPLLGREKELALAQELLKREDVGLVTLIGPGGTGKSRLGLQIALNMLDHFQAGVYLIRLTQIRDPELVIPTIAETLDIREANGGKQLIDTLRNNLQGKQMLLLIDNFEQVVEAAPHIANLMEACPSIKFIITSRMPLHVRSEKELFVPPLAMPELKQLPDLQNLLQYAAVSLFVQRARDLKPDFNITSENASAVAEICHRLDGLPLAIELAAARIKLLTPQELLARLKYRFDILRGGRDMPERQQTLRSAIDWSYDLLEDSAKAVFRRLSIFVGGWTLEAAEAVCALDPDDRLQIIDSLEVLIDNNLVTHSQDTDTLSRFGMLDTIHEYAYELLENSGELEQVRLGHAQYYLDFVMRIEPLIRSAERIHWTMRLNQEFDNVRFILNWISFTGSHAEIGQLITIQLGALWLTSGHLTEGRKWSSRLLEHIDSSTPDSLRAGMLWVSGGLAWAQGEREYAEANLDESVNLARKINDERLLANALLGRGLVADTVGDLESAKSMYEESYALHMKSKDLWGATLALSWLGVIAHLENNAERATQLLDQALSMAREQGDPWAMTGPLMTIGLRSILTNQLDTAYSTYLEAKTRALKLSDKWNLSWVLSGLGCITLLQGQIDQARAYFLDDLSLAREIDNPGALVIALVGAGAVIASRFKNMSEARQQYQADLMMAAKFCGVVKPIVTGTRPFLWYAWGEVYQRIVSNIRSQVDEAQWEKAIAQGRSMLLPQAVALAIQELKNPIMGTVQ